MKNELLQDEIKEKIRDIENIILTKGYSTVIMSVLQQRDKNRAEWQIRIDYDPANNDYPVYCLGERASEPKVLPHYRYFEEAKKHFIFLVETMVENNRTFVKNNQDPWYSSPLWNN